MVLLIMQTKCGARKKTLTGKKEHKIVRNSWLPIKKLGLTGKKINWSKRQNLE